MGDLRGSLQRGRDAERKEESRSNQPLLSLLLLVISLAQAINPTYHCGGFFVGFGCGFVKSVKVLGSTSRRVKKRQVNRGVGVGVGGFGLGR